MKVSGSHVETIESMSQNLFRIKEEQTIQIVTEKLSKEGKHVINIIHGTPSSLMGTVRKSITFLWETDDEDPLYKKYIEEQNKKKALALEAEIRARKQEDKKVKLRNDIRRLEKEINELQSKINDATSQKAITEKDIKLREYKRLLSEQNELVFFIFLLPVSLFCLLVGIIISSDKEFLSYFYFSVFFFIVVSGWLIYILIKYSVELKNNSGKIKQYLSEIENNKSKVVILKKSLEEKRKELIEARNELNGL
ncbi:MAG: hypothetical protein PUF31_01370 [Oscillospiraceae bacterium]|nr:hypothetical protein [Oscillospiraceae bacterium]